ncbi:MAG TPA: WD40 repeat domain-containing protein [Ktedonobacteraceae bacterium]
MSSNKPALLDLRGTFLFPELSEQGFLHQLGDGPIAHTVPIDEEHLIIHTATSVVLHSLPMQETRWEINCPSFNFAIDVPHHLLALAPGDVTIILWDLRTGRLLHRLTSSAENAEYRVNPNGLEFNHDGSILAAGMQSHDESVIALWNTADGHLLRVLSMDEYLDDITTLAFHPTGNLLAAGSFNDHRVWFWSLDDGSLLHMWDLSEDGCHDRPYDLAFSHDGTQLFVGGGTCGLRVWDVEQRQEAPRPLSVRDLQPNWLAVDPVGRLLAVMHFGSVGDQALRMLEIGSWRTVYEFSGEMSHPIFSLDGQLLAVSPARIGSARLLQAATGQELTQVKLQDFFAAKLALHPAGNVLAEGGNGRIRLRCAADGSLLHELLLQEHWSISEMAFAPGGNLLAVSRRYGLKQFAIDLWNSADGTLLFTLEGHTWSVLALAFSADGQLLASGSADKTLRVWDLESKQEIRCCKGHMLGLTSIAFAPNGSILASGSFDKTLCLWSMEDGKRLCELTGQKSDLLSVAFSPDGLTLASGEKEGGICLWSIAEQKQRGRLQAHTAGVNSLAFSPDGRFLASGSDDQTVRLWDYAGGQELSCLKPCQGKIQRVAFTADGHRLMTGAVDCIRFWRVEALVKEAARETG